MKSRIGVPDVAFYVNVHRFGLRKQHNNGSKVGIMKITVRNWEL
jgi:hypothetical protein